MRAAAPNSEDPRFSAAVAPTYVLAGLIDLARERGLRWEPWFVGSGLSPEQTLDPSARVSYRQAAQVIRRAVRAYPRIPLGLEVGSRESLASFGVLGFAMFCSRTLADALSVGMEYHQSSGSLMDPDHEVVAGEIRIKARERFPDPEILPFLCEELFASTTMVVRTLGSSEFRPLRLELGYRRPPHASDYERVFGCPVLYGAACNQVVIEASWLTRPLVTHNQITLAHALRLCREQVRATRGESDIVASVVQWLRGRLRGADMPSAARALNISERTLRRQLQERGLSFRQLHDRVREEVGTALLLDGDESIASIAKQLGFSDAREFRRAYRRWTQSTPSHVRSRGDED